MGLPPRAPSQGPGWAALPGGTGLRLCSGVAGLGWAGVRLGWLLRGELPRNYEGSPRISIGFPMTSLGFLRISYYFIRISYDCIRIFIWIS